MSTTTRRHTATVSRHVHVQFRPSITLLSLPAVSWAQRESRVRIVESCISKLQQRDQHSSVDCGKLYCRSWQSTADLGIDQNKGQRNNSLFSWRVGSCRWCWWCWRWRSLESTSTFSRRWQHASFSDSPASPLQVKINLATTLSCATSAQHNNVVFHERQRHRLLPSATT